MDDWFMRFYPFFGWAGILVFLIFSLVAAIVYRGKAGQRYSPGNHFVSELGEVGVSRLAWLFNLGLILSGAFFLLLMPGVGLRLNTVWGYIAMAAGIVAAAACMAVGFVPMNHLKPHAVVATLYFRSGMATVLLFSLAILLQPEGRRVIPLYVLIFGLLTFAAYAAFLVYAGKVAREAHENPLDPTVVQVRAGFWWLPFLEWLVVLFTMIWFVVISLV